jgi:hypothetical protein
VAQAQKQKGTGDLQKLYQNADVWTVEQQNGHHQNGA